MLQRRIFPFFLAHSISKEERHCQEIKTSRSRAYGRVSTELCTLPGPFRAE